MSKLIDYTGQQFGLVAVLSRAENRGKKTAWNCKCECGKQFTLLSSTLKQGKTKSCGCMRGKDLTNQKFNRLTPIQKTDKRTKDRNIIWKCKCDCGNICYVASSSLISGDTKSCGCLNDEQRRITGKNNKKDLVGQTFGRLKVIKDSGKRYDSNILWECQCECGNITLIKGTSLLHGVKSCGCLKSKGEYKIAKILSENNIPFVTQKTFDTCRYSNNYPAYFDFYVDNRYIIEFDGIQHFQSISGGWNTEQNVKYVQEHDAIKTQWCKDNNIPLIRIPYTKLATLTLQDLII